MGQLWVYVGGMERVIGAGGRLTLGRSPEHDIVLDHPLVSRHHLAVEWRPTGWVVVDTGSTNGFYVSGQRMAEYTLGGPLQVVIGHAVDGPVLDLRPGSAAAGRPEFPTGARMPSASGPGPGAPTPHAMPAASPAPQFAPAPQFPPAPQFNQGPAGSPVPQELWNAPHMQSLQYSLSALHQLPAGAAHAPAPVSLAEIRTIGRAPECDIVVQDVLASRLHARITSGPSGVVIEDLGSANGTFVNGRRISHEVLAEGSVVTIGNSDLTVRNGYLTPGAPAATVADGLHAYGISLSIGDKQLLDNISFSAGPGTLTAVIGPSGAGKSTVSKVVAGLVDPTRGMVTFQGQGVHAEYEALRTRIGMVPQDDVLHRRLTLRQALRYAAELRLPPDMSAADRDGVIEGVLGELQLLEHLDTLVDRLSGGQRKRASVAMELLTGPALLILDEPTSGLDPALDRQVMNTLRRLANAGRVVLVVTHSLTYMSMCDQVLLLAPGGRTAFCGPPGNVGPELGSTDWAEIFAFVADQPDAAHQRYRSRHGSGAPPPAAVASGPTHRSKQTGFLRQVSTVARRHIRLILADPAYLVFLFLMPAILGLLSLVIPGSAGFAVNTPDNLLETVQILVVLVVGAAFMGTALTVRDLVGERPIYERERAVGLRPGSYLAAKVLVFGAAAILQTLIMVGITYISRGVPTAEVFLPGWLELFVAIAYLAFISALIGLAISATVGSTEQTMPPLVIVIMVQLVFCGGQFPLAGRTFLEEFSWLFPARWGFAAAATSVDLPTVSPGTPAIADEYLWEHTGSSLLLSFGMMTLFGALFLAYTYRRLSRR